jgi:hypothetical protein
MMQSQRFFTGSLATPRVALCALAGFVLLSPRSIAQAPPGSAVPAPRLFTISPAGGRASTVVEIVWSGADTEEPQGFYFSHPGFKAEPIIPPAPPPPDPKKPPAKPAAPQPAGKPAALQPVTKFKITIPPDMPPGIYDIRLVNQWGISNPRAFVVDDLPEVVEKEPNDDVPQAQRVQINTVINGVIASPTDVDYFVFAGKKGQRVLIRCFAASIDSRLLAGMELYDSAGRQLAVSRYFRDQDAFIDYTLPRDGDYTVRLTEFTHAQGGAEHFYRLKISTTPWIDAISPLAVEPGKKASLTIYGRNLPGGQVDPAAVEQGRLLEKLSVQVDVPAEPANLQRLSFTERIPPPRAVLEGFEYRLRNASGISNPFLLSFARAPVILENEANDTPETAQAIKVPCEVSGCIEKRRDRDWYVFEAKKNEVHNIEVYGERLGAPADFYVLVRNAATKQDLAELDDNGDILHPLKFYTRTDDPPVYRFVAPADGKYQVMVSSRDADRNAGPRRYYRLRIVPENPDFHIIVLPGDDLRPDGFCLRQGGNEQYTVLVARHQGFNGPVALTVEGLPSWVSCPPQVVGPNLRQTALVLSAAANAPLITGEIKIKGTAIINGRTVVREARPASITWPMPQGQVIPAVSRLDRNLVMAIREKAVFNLTAKAETPSILPGSKINVALKLNRLWPDFKTPLQVAPIDPATNLPPNLLFNNNNQPITMNPGKDEASAVLEAKPGVPPGSYNIVLQGTAQVPFNKDPAAKQKANINVVLPATPIALTVLPQQVAQLSVNNTNPSLRIGKETELLVKVARLHDYAGPFKVHLILPPTMTDIGADEVTIPAGKDEVKLVVKAPANAVAGNRPSLIVRATAVIEGNYWLTHEVKINVNVVK